MRPDDAVQGAGFFPRSRSWVSQVFSVRSLRWPQIECSTLLIALLLLGLGMVFVRAMDAADLAFERQGVELFGGHLRKVLISLPCIVLAALVRPRWLRRNSYAIYALCILFLCLVPIIGETRNNARRWISMPMGFDLQPSELAKVGLILAMARVLYRSRLESLGEFWRPACLCLLPMGLVVLQPDLGTALTIVPVALGMLYLAGARARVLVGVVLIALSAAWITWRFELVRDYQLQRVDTWVASFEPEKLIEGRNGPAFHTYHARLVIGNGWWFGTKLGQGVANEAGHLPERDSDSIFAVCAEEGGFLGAAALLALYAMMIVLLLRSGSGVRERYSRRVVGGVGLYFAAHFFINVGVNLGLLPMTGLTLPLLSTGGSSLLATCTALGLALGLAANGEPSLDEDAFRS